MTELVLGIRRAVIIEESMIYYIVCDVSFVQYIPAKPIKNGIKLYALCCAFFSMLLSYQVYVGKENDTDNS